MNRILIVILFICFGLSAAAQQENNNTPGGKDRLVLELNWNTWLNSPDSIDLKWYSRGINLYFMYDIPFGESLFSIAPGLGIGIDNVYHDGRFLYNDSVVTMIPFSDTLDYSNNKLTTTYVDVPLELRFRSRPDGNNNSIKAGLGVKVGMLLSSHTKYVGEGVAFGAYQEEIKVKHKKVPELARFRYGLTARVGYGPFNLTAFYGLSELFGEGLGPAMTPFSVGIQFNGL